MFFVSTYFLFFRVQGDTKYADGITYTSGAKSNSNFLMQLFGMLNPLNWIVEGAQNNTISSAAYDALSGEGADVLIHPTYSITENNYLYIIRHFKASAEGYAGKYVNFRTDEDAAKMLRRPATFVSPGGVIVTPTGIGK